MDSSILTLPTSFDPRQLEFEYLFEETPHRDTNYPVWFFAWAIGLLIAIVLWQQIRVTLPVLVEPVTQIQLKIRQETTPASTQEVEAEPIETKSIETISTTSNTPVTEQRITSDDIPSVTKQLSILQMSRESARQYNDHIAPAREIDGIALPQSNRVFSNSLRRTLESAEVATLNTRRLSHRTEEFKSVYGDHVFRNGDTCYVFVNDPAIEDFGVFQKCMRPPPEVRRFGQRQYE